jgi:biopolymer transport protein TolR
MNQNRFRRSNSKKQFAEINVVPYVDVTLVLLIIFMVTAPIVQQAVTVDLPETPSVQKSSTPKNAAPPFVVSVTQDGLYTTSEKPDVMISDDELKTLIIEIVARSMVDSTMQFYIQGDTRAPYGKVVKLFTLLKVNGVEKVSLMTQPEGDA